MKREHIGRHVALAFGLALLIYLAAYGFIDHMRTRKGPWLVSFQTDSNGVPSLVVSQARLGISRVRFVFPEARLSQTNLASTVVFDQPTTNVPFGQVIYLDTTFLPGAIVFGVFDHEIQILPRVLILDHREIAWQREATYSLLKPSK